MEPIDLSDVSSLERKMLEYQCLKARAQSWSCRYTSAIGLWIIIGVITGRIFANNGFNFEVMALLVILAYLVWDYFKEGIGRERHAAIIALDEWLEENEEG